jgi:hypothetical protein
MIATGIIDRRYLDRWPSTLRQPGLRVAAYASD